jgi:cell fate regulator YaaT (PSP1 superfamily)
MVITDEGPAIGSVCNVPPSVLLDKPDKPLKKIFRLATEEEIERYDKGHSLEETVYKYCLERITRRDLPMRLVSVERRFDGSKIMVYFTADGRVDFRELVKDLVGKFRTRIEMRQIGVRHQAKMTGGLGPCGMALCCSSHLKEFAPVTIKMAKEQNLSLNPSKISGMCGRLMCCLTYEYPYYEKTKKRIPKIGKEIVTARGSGKVIRQNVLKQTVTVLLDTQEEVDVKLRDIIKKNNQPKKKKRSNQKKH